MNADKFYFVKKLIKDDMGYIHKYLKEIFVTIKKIADHDYHEKPEELKYFESIKNEYTYLIESSITVSERIDYYCEKGDDMFMPLFAISILNTQLQNFKSKLKIIHLLVFVHQTFENLEIHLQSASTHLWQIFALSNYLECWSIKSEIDINVFGLSNAIKLQYEEKSKY